jgi:hypothetical protein
MTKKTCIIGSSCKNIRNKHPKKPEAYENLFTSSVHYDLLQFEIFVYICDYLWTNCVDRAKFSQKGHKTPTVNSERNPPTRLH